MPSGDNDVVRTLLDHWERGELASRLDHLHPDVEVVSHTSNRGFEGYGGVRLDEAYAAAGLERQPPS